MKEIPQISESESEVMRLLWEKNPLTANEIISKLSGKMNWSDQTIKTFINRLLNKEAIRFEKSGRNYSYYPVISQDEYFKAENKTFLERVYKGAANLLFSKFGCKGYWRRRKKAVQIDDNWNYICKSTQSFTSSIFNGIFNAPAEKSYGEAFISKAYKCTMASCICEATHDFFTISESDKYI